MQIGRIQSIARKLTDGESSGLQHTYRAMATLADKKHIPVFYKIFNPEEYQKANFNELLGYELAKLNNEGLALEINFQHASFGVDYSKGNYDLIMARFAVEHIAEMEDIDSFMLTAHEKLKSGGWLAIIEYYVNELDIDDPIWKEFRRREMATYNAANAHARISLRLPESLRKANFQNISSIINHISPATIGAESFFNLP